MKTTYEVYWWGEDGPVYVKRTRRSGFRNRRRRLAEEHIGEIRGDEHREASFDLADASTLLLNRGYDYALTVLIDGEQRTLLVDAKDDYVSYSIPRGVELLDIEPFDADKLGHDEELQRVEAQDSAPSADEQPSERLDEASSNDEDRRAEVRTPRRKRRSGKRGRRSKG